MSSRELVLQLSLQTLCLQSVQRAPELVFSGVSRKDTTFAVSGVSGPSTAVCQLGVDISELGVSCCKILRRKAELLPGEIDGAGLVAVLKGCWRWLPAATSTS